MHHMHQSAGTLCELQMRPDREEAAVMKDVINENSKLIYEKVIKCLAEESDKFGPKESFQATSMILATLLPYVVEELARVQTAEEIKSTINDIVDIGLRDDSKSIFRKLS